MSVSRLGQGTASDRPTIGGTHSDSDSVLGTSELCESSASRCGDCVIVTVTRNDAVAAVAERRADADVDRCERTSRPVHEQDRDQTAAR